MSPEIKQALTQFILRVSEGEKASDKEVEIMPEVVKIVINDGVKPL